MNFRFNLNSYQVVGSLNGLAFLFQGRCSLQREVMGCQCCHYEVTILLCSIHETNFISKNFLHFKYKILDV